MSQPYDKYVKVIQAEHPRLTLHSAIPSGAELSIVFDHYRLRHDRRTTNRKAINLFFVAGTGMTKAIWRYHISKLFEYSESHQDLKWQIVNCVALDLVNHGDSAVENYDKLGFETDWREGALDLIQVVKSLKLSGQNVAIGHSMGGFGVLFAPTISPLMFTFVISIEPVILGERDNNGHFSRLLPALSRAIRSEFQNEQDYIKHFKARSFYRKFEPEILNDLIESERIVHKDGSISTKCSKEQQLICYIAASRTYEITKEMLNQVSVPVVYVTGLSSSWNPPTTVPFVRKHVKNIQSVEIQGGSHLLHCEKADETINIIIDALSRNVGSALQRTAENQDYETTFREGFQELYKAVVQSAKL